MYNKFFNRRKCIINFLIDENLFLIEDSKKIKKYFSNIIIYVNRLTSEKFRERSFENFGLDKLNELLGNITDYNYNMFNQIEEKNEILDTLKKINPVLIFPLINENYSLAELPKEAQEILKNIESCISLSNDRDTVNFMNKNLPIILKKYLSVDKEYRESLRNIQGLNAKELMIQSLEGLETIIQVKKEEKNTASLIDLSVQTRKYRIV